MLQSNHLLSQRVTRLQFSASPFSFPPLRSLLFLGWRTKPIKLLKITTFFVNGRRKTHHKQPAHSVRHVALSLYEPLAPTATSGQATPNHPSNPHLHATIFTTVQRNLCRHHNPLSSACKCLQAGAERRGAAAPLRTVGVCWYADHTRQGRGRHRVMMLRVHGEWRRMNG